MASQKLARVAKHAKLLSHTAQSERRSPQSAPRFYGKRSSTDIVGLVSSIERKKEARGITPAAFFSSACITEPFNRESFTRTENGAHLIAWVPTFVQYR